MVVDLGRCVLLCEFVKYIIWKAAFGVLFFEEEALMDWILEYIYINMSYKEFFTVFCVGNNLVLTRAVERQEQAWSERGIWS